MGMANNKAKTKNPKFKRVLAKSQSKINFQVPTPKKMISVEKPQVLDRDTYLRQQAKQHLEDAIMNAFDDTKFKSSRSYKDI